MTAGFVRVQLRRNVACSAAAVQKASDPIQQMFVEKVSLPESAPVLTWAVQALAQEVLGTVPVQFYILQCLTTRLCMFENFVWSTKFQ
jgi:hypothetical protein